LHGKGLNDLAEIEIIAPSPQGTGNGQENLGLVMMPKSPDLGTIVRRLP